jgi:hypothetical protein
MDADELKKRTKHMERLAPLLKECNEIVAILTASVKTARATLSKG